MDPKCLKLTQLFLLLLCLFSLPVWAQDAPSSGSSADVLGAKITAEAKKETEKKKGEVIDIQPPVTLKPAAPDIKIFVKTIRLQLHPSISPQEVDTILSPEIFKPLLAQYENREITFAQLTELTQRIENEFRIRGYLAVARVPAQEIKDGQPVIEILVSRMGQIRLEGNRFYRSKKTLSYSKLKEGDFLSFVKIRNSLLGMNENPDRQVKPYLKAGAKPGSTDIVLKTEEHFPLHAGYTVDNQGVKLTGKTRHTFLVRHNNFLSLDDIFLAGTTFGKDFVAAFTQHVIPLNSVGTRLVWGFTHALVTPRKEFKSLKIRGISDVYSMALRQRLWRSERFVANVYTGFDFKEKHTRSQGAITVWDRLRILSTGADLQWNDSTGFWTVHNDFYFSFSPHGDGYPLTSRGAESRFFKYGAGLERRQRLPWRTEGSLKFEAQLSENKLPPQEEFFMGGAGTVRGYPESDFGADQGIFTSLEYKVPAYFFPEDWKLPYYNEPLREQIRLLAFLDHGYGILRDPSSDEKKKRNLLGVGAGLQIQLSENLYTRLEWGFPLGDDGITESGDSQFHFRVQSNI